MFKKPVVGTIENLLDKGRIIEEGNHKELLKKGKLYARMFNTQAIGYK